MPSAVTIRSSVAWSVAAAAFGSAVLAAEAAGAEWVEGAAAGAAPLTFYRVRAVNPCGQEGP